MKDYLALAFKFLFALLFIGGGLNHFVDPEFYLAMMPPYLPLHSELVLISGVFEILLGVGLLIPKYSRKSAWGLIALLLAVFPANIYMYTHAELFSDVPKVGLLIRLPIQLVLIFWAHRYTIVRKN